MHTIDIFGKDKAKDNIGIFVYLETNLDIIGLDNLTEEQLMTVVDAFDYGKSSFFVSGKRYFFNEPLEFHIFKIDLDSYPSFSVETYSGNNLIRRYHKPDYLASIGVEVTNDFIKGDYGWKKGSFEKKFFQQFGSNDWDSVTTIDNSNLQQNCFNSYKVFIVHGHDAAAKEATARFIESLGLEAIILHEQVNNGQTIIEKLESNSDVGFAVILYTPCDRGGVNGEDEPLKLRARQNVVFEHGLFVGKLGRGRVVSLVKGDVETPGDVSGVVYTTMDEAGAWKIFLAKELKSAGYKIDMNKII